MPYNGYKDGLMLGSVWPFVSQSAALLFDCGSHENHPQAALPLGEGDGALN